MISLDSPVASVLGAQTKQGKAKKITDGLGLRTVGDLLHHFPRRYVRTGELTTVTALRSGEMLTVVGEITESDVHTYLDRRSRRTAYRLDTTLQTDGPSLRMSFFAKSKGVADWQAGRLAVGRRGVFIGQVSTFKGQWQLTNPTMALFGVAGDEGDETTGAAVAAIKALFPLYPLTKGVESWDLQRAVAFALTILDEVPDPLPGPLREAHGLPDLHTALQWVHQPDTWEQVTSAQRRFRFDEALVTQLVLARRRAELAQLGGQARSGGGGLLAAFDARLPFTLTRGQEEVSAEIEADLARSHPMNRLLQGEVGSGKTLVALRAMLRVVDSGGQAALLAPTEVLAQQHLRSITAMLGDLAAGGMLGGHPDATTVVLLTGSMPKAARAEAMLRAASGEAGIVIGTHALLQEHVQFADLGLVVVDEQHRFGVEQRAALTDKAGTPPHVLVMTATPIPRTVAMTVFGDLEVSTLTELPAGRAAVQTSVVPLAEQPHWVDRVWGRVREEVERGHQVYVVCPRIAGDELEQGETDEPPDEDDGAAVDQPRPAQRGRGGGRGAARRAAGRAAARPAPRAARPRRQGPRDASVRGRRDRRPGLDHGDRGRRRRRQRHHDGAARRRPVRHLPAPPAPRPGRPGRPARSVPAGHPRAGRHPRPRAARRGGRHHRRLRAQPGRPRAAPRGRRAGPVAVGFPQLAAEPPRPPRREDDRRGARGRDRPAGRRSGPRPGSRARPPGDRTAGVTAV